MPSFVLFSDGGAEGDRTPDLCNAIAGYLAVFGRIPELFGWNRTELNEFKLRTCVRFTAVLPHAAVVSGTAA